MFVPFSLNWVSVLSAVSHKARPKTIVAVQKAPRLAVLPIASAQSLPRLRMLAVKKSM
jgi:hypothetical protein